MFFSVDSPDKKKSSDTDVSFYDSDENLEAQTTGKLLDITNMNHKTTKRQSVSRETADSVLGHRLYDSKWSRDIKASLKQNVF